MSRSASHAWLRFASPFLVLLGAAGNAAAQTTTAATGGAIVQIAGAALLPERLSVADGQQLVFRNDSASLARVELDLPHGHGIVCTSNGEPSARGRKFVVASGASLACEAPPSAVTYRVFRSDGGGIVESSGRIEIAPGG